MAFRILVGCCIFGVGWYAVDKMVPGFLPQIEFANKIPVPRFLAAPAVEDMDSKDTKDIALGATGVGESGSVTQGHGVRAGDLGVGSLENNYSIAVRAWLKARTIIYEHMVDALVSPDLQRLLRATWTAVQEVDWVSDIGYKACLLLTSTFCLVIATWCCKSGSKENKINANASTANPVHVTAVDWKSNFSMSDMACLKLHGYRHEGGYIYPTGIAATQLSRQDAAAAVIQRWARTEFKRWLLHRTSSRSSIDTPPPISQRWIDEDHGAVVSTVLEDCRFSADEVGPPGGDHCSDNELPSENRPSETKCEGVDDAESRPVIRCRKGLSLSSAKLSKAVLRLKPPAGLRTGKGPASTPP